MTTLDHTSYPHIVDLIVSYLPDPSTNTAFRSTSRYFRAKVDAFTLTHNRLRYVKLDTHKDKKEGLGRDAISFRSPYTGEMLLRPIKYKQVTFYTSYANARDRVRTGNWQTKDKRTLGKDKSRMEYHFDIFDKIKIIEVSGLFQCAPVVHGLVPGLQVLRIKAGSCDLYNFRPRKVAYLCSAPRGFSPITLRHVEEVHFNVLPGPFTTQNNKYFQTSTLLLRPNMDLLRIFVHFTHANYPERLTQKHTLHFVTSLGTALVNDWKICLIDADHVLGKLPRLPLEKVFSHPSFVTLTPRGVRLPGLSSDWAELIAAAAFAELMKQPFPFELMPRRASHIPPQVALGFDIAARMSCLKLSVITSAEYRREVGNQAYEDVTFPPQCVEG